MAEVVLRPYGVSARIGKDNTVYLHARRAMMVDGVDVKDGDAEPLAGLDDPIFLDFAERFNALAVAERDALREERDELARQNNSLRMQMAMANDRAGQYIARIAQLEAEVARLTNGN